MAETMPALTIWQPWATLIIEGLKPYEFRAWDFRSRYPRLVGKRIAIHAGARPVVRNEVADLLRQLFSNAARDTGLIVEPAIKLLERVHLSRAILPLSSVLGTAILGKPTKNPPIVDGRPLIADSDRLEDCNWAWPLTEIERFEPPIPAGGAQGFWRWRKEDANG